MNSTIEFIRVPVEGPMDVSMKDVDSEVGEVSNLTPTPAPRRSTRIRSQNHLDTNFFIIFHSFQRMVMMQLLKSTL